MNEIIPYETINGRFSSAPWMPVYERITLIGVGGIGSYCAFYLSRIHPSLITMYDDDNVEAVNYSGQMFEYGNDNEPKVTVASKLMYRYSKMPSVNAFCKKYEGERLEEIVLCGLDNMASRKQVFDEWVKQDSSEILIDGRLAAERLQVYCLTKDNPEMIQKYADEALFSDEEAEATICSYKQTSHMAGMIASLMTTVVTNYITNKKYGRPIRELPYLSSFDAVTFNLNVI